MTILRSLILAELALCSASLVDSVLIGSTFCGFRSSCSEVTSSIYGRPLGIPLPVIGLAGFGLMLCLSFARNRHAVFLLRILALSAGMVGLALIAIQTAVLNRLCSLCLVIDTAGIGLAITAMLLNSAPSSPSYYWLRCSGWTGAALILVALPILWGLLQMNPAPPPQVKAHWVAGKVNVVELTDFDCPYCAKAEQITSEALRSAKDYNFVRIPAPMPKHANARPAARAYLAAMRQGKGENMSAALFAARARTAGDCRKLAAGLGLDLERFDRDVADPAVDAELDDTLSWAQRAGPGLPMLWVQDRFFAKVPSLGVLERALREAPPYDPGRERW